VLYDVAGFVKGVALVRKKHDTISIRARPRVNQIGVGEYSSGESSMMKH
jgi:hypothetical protein